MAAGASRREAQRNVINWRLGVVVIRLMAGRARGVRKVIVVIDVAQGALRRRVRARQRPARRRMVELSICPQNCVVTAGAGRRKAQGNVVDRRLRVVVIRLVARYAVCIGQFVIIVDVALRARRRRMEACQRPACAGVIEFAVRPENRIVASFARQRESKRDMVNGRLRIVVIRLMTGCASRAGQVVVVVDVALRTLQSCMRTRQRETS